jgi:hypothetical protein
MQANQQGKADEKHDGWHDKVRIGQYGFSSLKKNHV